MLHPLLPKGSHASVLPWLPSRRHWQDAGFTSCPTTADLVLQHSADSRQPHTAQEGGILTFLAILAILPFLGILAILAHLAVLTSLCHSSDPSNPGRPIHPSYPKLSNDHPHPLFPSDAEISKLS